MYVLLVALAWALACRCSGEEVLEANPTLTPAADPALNPHTTEIPSSDLVKDNYFTQLLQSLVQTRTGAAFAVVVVAVLFFYVMRRSKYVEGAVEGVSAAYTWTRNKVAAIFGYGEKKDN